MISYTGKKTRLRPVQKADLETTIRWKNDPQIREHARGYRFPVTEEMEERWLETVVNDQSRTRVVFAIEALQDDAFIGFIHLNRIDWISRWSYFGVVLGESAYHGKGMAADSMDVLFRYAFDALNLRKICLEVASFNDAAIRLYRQYGFVDQGVLSEHLYLEGVYHDVVTMRLLATEFRAKQAPASAG